MKVLMLPSGKLAEKHKKLVKRGECSKCSFLHRIQDRLLQIIGNFFIKRQKIEENFREVKYMSKKGVCLSTGGFIFNRQMVKEYAPKYYAGMPLGTSNDQVAELGLAKCWRKDRSYESSDCMEIFEPSLAFAQGIVVNKHGKRFCNEMVMEQLLEMQCAKIIKAKPT